MLLNVAEAQQLVAERRPAEALDVLEVTHDDALTRAAAWHRAVLRAEVLLRLGRAEDALGALVPARDPQGSWPIDVLALVVGALATEQLGRHAEAGRLLARAVDVAAPARLSLPFLTSARVRPLLDSLLDRGTRHEETVLDILAGVPAPMPSAHSSRSRYVDPLTGRETEVLRAMQGTATNEELAQRLFVSVNTVRTHMKHINQKLDTSSRREAVARGRELGLI
jgi:LuxR family maltose regulon positive regulatory protein